MIRNSVNSKILCFIILSQLCLTYSVDSSYHVDRSGRRSDNIGARLVSSDDLPENKYHYEVTSHEDNIYTPVLFWHGMGDTAYGSLNVVRMALEEKFPGMKVFSVQIGNSALEDELAGYFVNVNSQIEQVCSEVLKNPTIKAHGSFNAIGFSQGSQFIRGLIQRCPFQNNGIKVKNLITLGGQHQGVFGLPKCDAKGICDYIRYLLSHGAYTKEVQEHLVQAEYWHDPMKEEDYKQKSVFIAEINNELTFNETYKKNLLSLENFVMILFKKDEMVVPRESSLFGFYEAGRIDKIVSMEESQLYKQDRLGLKQLNESGRIKKIEIQGQHLQFHIDWFLSQIASVYLSN